MSFSLAGIIKTRSGQAQCHSCGGVGFVLNEHVRGARSGLLGLCHCTHSHCNACPSQGEAPFLVYDQKLDGMVPCFCAESRSYIRKAEQLVSEANIPPRYQFQFLSTIELTDSRSDPELSFMVAHDWANELVLRYTDSSYTPKGFFLWGGTGTGKTLLACVILNELIFRYGIKCKYAKVNKDFLSILKDSYQIGSELYGMERAIEREFATVDVLVIDDFGVHKESEYNNQKLYDLIDSRYEQEKLTFMTSNLSLEEWHDKWQGRIYSRLKEMNKEIQLKCQDFRLRYSK